MVIEKTETVDKKDRKGIFLRQAFQFPTVVTKTNYPQMR